MGMNLPQARPVEKLTSIPEAVQLRRGGHEPAPLGTIVIRTEKVGPLERRGPRRTIKVRYIKTRMDGPSGLRWTAYARWWWEQNRGLVPPGQMVLHRNGDTLDDSPNNLFLGGPGDKIKLAHELDPEMSRKNRESQRAGTAAFNRLSAKLRRLQKPVSRYWYPVADEVMAVIDLPHRSRKALLLHLGARYLDLPKNGRGMAYSDAADSIGVRLVRGRDLSTGLLSAYLRIDPETGVGIGERARMESREIKKFMQTELWARAQVPMGTRRGVGAW